MENGQIQWIDYLYSNSKGKLFNVISNYGYPLPDNLSETYECVSFLIEKEGEKAEKEILKCFPEFSGISKMIKSDQNKNSDYLNFNETDKISKLESKIELSKLEMQLSNLKQFQNILIFSTMLLMFHFLNKK